MKELKNQTQIKDYNGIITHYKKEYDRNRKTNKSLHTTAEKILCNTKNRMVKL
jgi:hypothetical protein